MSEEIPLLPEERFNLKRYGVLIASVFVVGTICGSGVLAIPQAVVDSGWSGVALLVLSGAVAAYNGTLLGECWSVLKSRYPEYDEVRITDPYPKIGYRAAGKIGEYATRICIDVTLFGGGTVFILLIAENIKTLILAIGGGEFYICYLVMILWFFLTPLSWLGTPKDFWPAAIIAAVTTSIGALLIFVGIVEDASSHGDAMPKNVTVSSFFNAFGTILYAFGGASVFPTIQLDMKDPNRFPLAAIIGMSTILALYLPAGISGLLVFKSDMTPNVITALSKGAISIAINILITSHLIMAFMIISNPVTQEIEGIFKIRDRFSWKRVMVRSIYTLGIVFVALSVPHFNLILALVGSSAIACTSFIFPPLFYYLLSLKDTPHGFSGNDESSSSDEDDYGTDYQRRRIWKNINLRLPTKIFLLLVVVVGVAGGLSSTYFAFAAVVNGSSGFTVPCYVNSTVQ